MARCKAEIICEAREYNLKLTHGVVSELDKMKIELLLGASCEELKSLAKQYNECCIKAAQRKKDIDDPTSQEDNVKGR